MVAEGRRSSKEVGKKIVVLERLDSKMVEYGIVYKHKLHSDDHNSIAILYVAPNSKISEHRHNSDNEVYYDMDGHNMEVCFKGNSHSLTNISKDKWLIVLSYKII